MTDAVAAVGCYPHSLERRARYLAPGCSAATRPAAAAAGLSMRPTTGCLLWPLAPLPPSPRQLPTQPRPQWTRLSSQRSHCMGEGQSASCCNRLYLHSHLQLLRRPPQQQPLPPRWSLRCPRWRYNLHIPGDTWIQREATGGVLAGAAADGGGGDDDDAVAVGGNVVSSWWC